MMGQGPEDLFLHDSMSLETPWSTIGAVVEGSVETRRGELFAAGLKMGALIDGALEHVDGLLSKLAAVILGPMSTSSWASGSRS